MKRIFFALVLVCALVESSSAATFSLANLDFSKATWNYVDSMTFQLKGYVDPVTTGEPDVLAWQISGTPDANNYTASNVTVELFSAGPWEDYFAGTYTATVANFTDYQNFSLMMSAGSAAADSNGGALNGATLEFQAQSWVVGDYTNGDLTNAQVTVVPEPATLTVLGLGALLIRRKRNS